MNLKNGKVFTSKSVGTGPSSYEKKNLLGRGLTKVEERCSRGPCAIRESLPPAAGVPGMNTLRS